MTCCNSLPLTRLEGLKELTRQLHNNKGQIRELLKECHGVMLKQDKNGLREIQACSKCSLSLPLLIAEHANSILVKLVLSLLQLCKLAANYLGGADMLGMK